MFEYISSLNFVACKFWKVQYKMKFIVQRDVFMLCICHIVWLVISKDVAGKQFFSVMFQKWDMHTYMYKWYDIL